MIAAIILGGILLTLHFLHGVKFRRYLLHPWFAHLVHVFGGMFLFSLTGTLFGVLLLASLWEFFEFIFDRYTRLGDLLSWKCRSWGQAFDGVFWCMVGAVILKLL